MEFTEIVSTSLFPLIGGIVFLITSLFIKAMRSDSKVKLLTEELRCVDARHRAVEEAMLNEIGRQRRMANDGIMTARDIPENIWFAGSGEMPGWFPPGMFPGGYPIPGVIFEDDSAERQDDPDEQPTETRDDQLRRIGRALSAADHDERSAC